MAETVRPLELLVRVARRHGATVGIVASARGPKRLTETKIQSLEVREAGDGFWSQRELVGYAHAGPGLAMGDLPIDEAAAELLESLGRQGWLDEDDGA